MPIPLVAAISAAASVGSAALASSAAKKAASTQASAAQQASDIQQAQFDKQVALQEPFRQAGLAGQNKILTLLGLDGGDRTSADFGVYDHDFGNKDFVTDPGYGFRVSEGLKAVERSAAARGGLLSGNTLRGVTELGQNLGSQEYQAAYNRYQTDRTNRLNPLQSLQGGAQTSANQLSNAAQNLGNANAENALQAGNARASGYVGSANALNNAIASGINNWQSQQYLNILRNGGANTGVNGGGLGQGSTVGTKNRYSTVLQ
jgi:hypothetical protein